MKQVLFRCRDLSIVNEKGERVVDLNLEILSGETIYLLGKKDAGREIFFEFLKGTVPEERGIVKFAERENTAFISEKDRIALMNRTQDAMTVMEFIYLFQKNTTAFLWKRRAFERKTDELLAELKLPFDHRKKISDLSPKERLLTDIARSLLYDARIILMEESFLGLTNEEKRQVTGIMEQIKKDRGIAFVINSDSVNFDTSFQGQCMVFGDTHTVIRKYGSDFAAMQKQYQSMMKPGLEYGNNPSKDAEIVLSMEYAPYGRTDFECLIKAGNILYLHEASDRNRMLLSKIFSGQTEHADITLKYKGKELPEYWSYHKETYPIVVMERIGMEGLYPNLSVSDNLLLPSYKKIASPGFRVPGKRIAETAKREWTKGRPISENIEKLTAREQMELQMESWLMLRPQVLVLLDPFWGMDEQLKNLLVEYLLRFKKMGCGILVISADSHYDAERISGRWFDEHCTGVGEFV
jgi:ABC-type sugar transport system ATPase subunit